MTESDIFEMNGAKFFGKISASVSHEIKNVLAIINESAGLVVDLTELARAGTPVDAERIATLAQKVRHQVRRADGIVNNLNRFAHSADEAVTNVDLRDVLRLMSALCERLATMRGVSLSLQETPTPLIIRTNCFLLENLMWLCLDFAIQRVDKTKSIALFAEATAKGAQFKIHGMEGLNDLSPTAFPGASEKALMEALKADLSIDMAGKQMVVMLPK